MGEGSYFFGGGFAKRGVRPNPPGYGPGNEAAEMGGLLVSEVGVDRGLSWGRFGIRALC